MSLCSKCFGLVINLDKFIATLAVSWLCPECAHKAHLQELKFRRAHRLLKAPVKTEDDEYIYEATIEK